MYNLPFDKPGQFYRGNLHTHSTASDGSLTPERVCAKYREARYDFLALTDHFLAHYNWPVVDTRPYRAEGFTTLLGAELHTPDDKTEFGDMWHILAVGLPLDFAPTPPGQTGPQLAQRALDAGAFVAVAHPYWYSLTEADVISLGDCQAIEVFNGTSIDHNDRADSWYMLDLMSQRGRHYSACATDDAHLHAQRADFATGWVWVKSESLEPDALLDALKAGLYYSSTGPQIHDIRVEANRVTVRCSPAERVFLTGGLANSTSVYGPGITEASLPLSHIKSPYCRVTVRDAHGGRAWSNPIWLR
ncbi:MAG: CehA/McbA family metallohydrolase [Anaerolineae bacterium]|nr:CehA/McbA family metallohydrolase [Anaerolineae bacterium]